MASQALNCTAKVHYFVRLPSTRVLGGMGHGKALVDAALSKARQNGACNVYLLTDNASKYFENLGFASVDREDIDGVIKASPEFGVCAPRLWRCAKPSNPFGTYRNSKILAAA